MLRSTFESSSLASSVTCRHSFHHNARHTVLLFYIAVNSLLIRFCIAASVNINICEERHECDGLDATDTNGFRLSLSHCLHCRPNCLLVVGLRSCETLMHPPGWTSCQPRLHNGCGSMRFFKSDS
jgi:hypothetical protein